MSPSFARTLALAAALAAGACFDGVFGAYDLATGTDGAPSSGGASGAGGLVRGHEEGGSGGETAGQGGVAGASDGGAAGVAGVGGSAGEVGAGGEAGFAGEPGGGMSGSSGQGGAVGGGPGSGGAAGQGGGPTGFCSASASWACDPITTTSCGTVDGSACDIDVTMGRFSCFGPPNTLPLGAPCKLEGPGFCQQGGTCLNGACVRFCCDDTSCSNHDTCQPGSLPGVTVGLCACDPKVRAGLAPTLGTLAQEYAFGDAEEGAALCGALSAGGALKRQIILLPGRCYTAIGVNDASDMQLALHLDSTASPPMPFAISPDGAAPVLGAQPVCFKLSGTVPIAAVFQIIAKKGAGNVIAQLYSK